MTPRSSTAVASLIVVAACAQVLGIEERTGRPSDGGGPAAGAGGVAATAGGASDARADAPPGATGGAPPDGAGGIPPAGAGGTTTACAPPGASMCPLCVCDCLKPEERERCPAGTCDAAAVCIAANGCTSASSCPACAVLDTLDAALATALVVCVQACPAPCGATGAGGAGGMPDGGSPAAQCRSQFPGAPCAECLCDCVAPGVASVCASNPMGCGTALACMSQTGCRGFPSCSGVCAGLGVVSQATVDEMSRCLDGQCQPTCGTGCVPKACGQPGAECGVIEPGCGQPPRDCGNCPGATVCGGGGIANVCGSGCMPRNCGPAGLNCGLMDPGCGLALVDCGVCAPPQTCGGGGIANQCGGASPDGGACVPTTCAQAGANCGIFSPGCGSSPVFCGSCSGAQTCGGGGVPNVCGVGAACADAGIAEPCGRSGGACVPGLVQCAGGALQCVGAIGPTPEVCNGRDDDCDGGVDEDLPETPCSTGQVGICSAGTQSCIGGSLLCTRSFPSDTERCGNFVDDDCDGDVDEAGCTPCVPQAEVCNGWDDDCDGDVDENAPGQGAACGSSTSPCMPGTLQCMGGKLVCVGGKTPSGEVCDGLDNDCDGSVDEAAELGLGYPCGVSSGTCAHGTAQCVGGTVACVGGTC